MGRLGSNYPKMALACIWLKTVKQIVQPHFQGIHFTQRREGQRLTLGIWARLDGM